MAISIGMVTFDTTNPKQLAEWWAQALGSEVVFDSPHFAQVGGHDGPTLGFALVEDPTPGKNKLHLDCGVADRHAEAERLVGLGATQIRDVDGPPIAWVTLADPEGNQFCLSDTPH